MSIKVCSRCHKQGQIIDSRKLPEYVRRRYRCNTAGCGNSWTTVELMVEEGTRPDPWKIRHWRQAEEKKAHLNALDRIRAMIEGESSR